MRVPYIHLHQRLTKDWWDVGPTSQLRTWQDPTPDPFSAKWAAFRDVPGMDKPEMIQPDIMHCYNLGFGKDLAASGIIMGCHQGVFGEGSMPMRAERAFGAFMLWCEQNGHTSSIKEFDLKKTFKMQTYLTPIKLT